MVECDFGHFIMILRLFFAGMIYFIKILFQIKLLFHAHINLYTHGYIIYILFFHFVENKYKNLTQEQNERI
jgi:hypothetical protein